MQFLTGHVLNQFLVFVLVLARVSGLVMLAPVWGAGTVPARVRAFLAIGLSLIVTPLVCTTSVPLPENVARLAMLLGCEFALGLSLGLAVMIFFAGLQIAGQLAGQMTGMSLAETASPSFDANIPVFGELLNLLVLAIFVVTGGHHQLLDALFQAFQQMPPGHVRFSPSLVDALTEVTAYSFRVGLQVSLPLMLALLLSILVMGLISRTLPQLNVLAVGFSVNSVVMLAALLLSLGILSRVFQEEALVALEIIRPVYYSPTP